MSKLEKLIKDLCPKDVEYKRFGDFARITRGGNFQKKDFVDNGIPCIHYGQIYTKLKYFVYEPLTFINEDISTKQRFAKPNDIIMAITSENVEDICKCVAWLGNTDIAVSGHAAIIHHNQNPKYLVYYLRSEHFYNQKTKLAHGTKVIEVSPDKINNVVIPIPPLAIQEEIVRILDTFTELEAELEAELVARKKQYEYYRNMLLTFGDDIPIIPLCDVFDLRNGYTPSKSNQEYWTDGTIPWIRMEDIRANGRVIYDSIQKVNKCSIKGSGLFPSGTVAFSTSATIGEHCLLMVDCLTNQRFTAIIPKRQYRDKLIPKYTYYLGFKIDQYCLEHQQVSSMPSVDMNAFKEYMFPIPPLAEQERIVSILDKFDTLCNDISQGLPKELELRRKQYEYYRDKLLSFKRKEA